MPSVSKSFNLDSCRFGLVQSTSCYLVAIKAWSLSQPVRELIYSQRKGIVELGVLIPVRTCATSKLRDAYYHVGLLDRLSHRGTSMVLVSWRPVGISEGYTLAWPAK